MKERVLRELIEERVILQEARRQKMAIEPEEIDRAVEKVAKHYPGNSLEEVLSSQRMSWSRWRERMKQKLLMEKIIADISRQVPKPAPDQIEAYFKSNPEQFQQEEQFRLQQIVVKTQEDAERILDEIKKGNAFEELARQHSLTPEAAQGGHLGFIAAGVMPQTIDEHLPKMKKDELSPILASNYGFHVLRLLDSQPAKKITLEEARSKIVQILTQNDREKRIMAWRQDVLAKAKIERNHALLASIR